MPWMSDAYFTDVDGSFGDFMLVRDLIYLDWDGKKWVTPQYFVSDLSSIPFFLRFAVPKTGLGKAPILHDYLYRTPKPYVSRKHADYLFYIGAVDEGMSKWKAKSLYYGLRSGGWLSWRKSRKGSKKE